MSVSLYFHHFPGKSHYNRHFINYMFGFSREDFFVWPVHPGTHSVGQAGPKLKHPPAFASPVLGFKVRVTTTSWP